jgi:hypothetical protein
MGSKSWVVILAMGFGGVGMLGLMAKFAIDSSPALQSVIRFKGALAQDFAAHGFEEVALRSMPRRHGFQLTLTVPSAATEGEFSRLDTELARYFVKHFQGKQGGLLGISYHTPGTFACRGPEALRQAEVPLQPIRAELEEEERIARLTTVLRQSSGLNLVSHRREPHTLFLDVEIPAEDPGDLEALARSTSDHTRMEFRRKPYMFLQLRFFGVAAPPAGEPTAARSLAAPVLEARFDYRGKRLNA